LTALEEESNLRELPIDVYLTNSLSGIAAVKDRCDGTFHELIAEINSLLHSNPDADIIKVLRRKGVIQ
jgi:hypothetical protein